MYIYIYTHIYIHVILSTWDLITASVKFLGHANFAQLHMACFFFQHACNARTEKVLVWVLLKKIKKVQKDTDVQV